MPKQSVTPSSHGIKRLRTLNRKPILMKRLQKAPKGKGEGVGVGLGIPKTGNRLARTVLTDLEHRQKRLLRNIHLADALHPLLALFLLLEQLALA